MSSPARAGRLRRDQANPGPFAGRLRH
jgi:hypothetical protein